MKIVKFMLIGFLAFGPLTLYGQQAGESNAVIEAILSRRSIRQYQDKAVERAKLETIVKCGINAPSANNRQPWIVRVVSDDAFIESMTEIYKKENPNAASQPNFKNMFRNAPAVIFIASPKSQPKSMFDCGLLAQNMMLAAQSLGLGSICLGAPTRFMTSSEAAKPYLDKLEIPQDYELLYTIGVGYPDEQPAARDRDASKVKFIE